MAIHHQLELWGNVTSPPIQTVTFGPSNFSFEMLRLDLMKGWASGNKYYKLKIPLYHFISQQVKHVVSKGGMFSNHLVALAEACHAFDISLNCIVRSYEPDEENPTIRYLKSLNADIQYFSPGEYLNFDEDKSQQLFPDAYFIPEGGLSTDGILGVGDLVNEFNAQHYDHIVLAAGTMCTACGIISRLSSNAQVHIVPAWKGCTSDYVEKIFDKYELPRKANWDIWPDYHFGGFGKFNDALIQLMTDFTKQTSIPLDPVYNGKVVYALMDQLKKGEIAEGEKVLVIHTGGLQGIKGYAYRFPGEWGQYSTLVDEFGKG